MVLESSHTGRETRATSPASGFRPLGCQVHEMPSNRFRRWVRRLAFVLVGLFSLAPALRAQLTWDPVASPTSQNLWGVCFGGGQFVAVGEGGTILTSPDGSTWTARNSGTAAWITGVTFANQLYVAVGDQGTIVTSPDAATWTRRAIGGPRLNGVAYGNGRFLAVGEQGTVQVSTDAVTWTPGNVGVNGWLRGIIYAEGKFLITGQSGVFFTTTNGGAFTDAKFTALGMEAIDFDDGYYTVVGEPQMFFSSTDQRSWVRRGLNLNRDSYLRGARVFNNTSVVVGTNGLIAFSSSRQAGAFAAVTISSTAQFNAIAASAVVAVTVGSSGTIYRSLPESSPPRFDEQPRSYPGISAYVGSAITLVGKAGGSGPMTYQWSLNGTPIAGATSYKLELNAVSLAQTGIYSVVATNPRGTASSAYTLNILPLPVSNAVDPSFVSPLAGPTTPTEPIIVAQPDGKVLLVGPYTISPIDGRPIGIIRLKVDGSIDESFHLSTTPPTIGYIQLQPSGKIILNGSQRLNSNGFIDPAFVIDPSLKGPEFRLIMFPDGRLLALHFSSDRSSVIVTRLTPDGTIDSTFTPYSLPITALGYHRTGDNLGSSLQAVDSNSRILVLFGSNLRRFLPDGQFDAGFIADSLPGTIRTLQTFGNKPEYAALNPAFSFMIPAGNTVGRLNEDGTEDTTFHRIQFSNSFSSVPFTVVFNADGSITMFPRVDFILDALAHTEDSGGVWRFTSAGIFLPGSSPQLDYYGRYIRAAQLLPNGQLLVAGDFTSLNSIPTSRVARLNFAGAIYETQLSNLSIRTRAGNSDQKLIAGFVVGGSTGTMPVLARGIGPELANYGVSGALTDPHVDLYQETTLLASNDDWDPALLASFAQVGAFPLSAHSKDAALKPSLGPGAYSLHVSGASSTTGIALAEIYDSGPAPSSPEAPRLVNVSGRAFVGSGEDSLIAGFVVSGHGTKRLLIRAVGPTLASYGVSGVLAEPELLVYRESTLAGTGFANNTEARDAAATVNAFVLTSNSADAALVIDVSPGVYSAQVRGKNGATGVALVEIYELP
ncbi:MAG: hypothetical protein JWM35_79 [Verrucomicrobia bacterium]|nr:hypothetical protein [Verrucomicrobiota bacterium]